ncbi:FIST signal transduction protein [Pararhodonellum marinum]|uniref:FIST signal transduction protein n=1 Tax=Pararhodonellum marinum TaxID=2755358 RepID=UPI001890A421|nr:FIST N-terminal domain-containing protein [Pararhodonellum marinum]
MKAKSIKGRSAEEIKTALAESMAEAHLPDGQGFKPTLALVFISVKQDIDTIISILDGENIQVFGATTSGEISDSDISHEAISILLMDMDPANFRIWYDEYAGSDVVEVAKAMTAQALTIFEKPAFLLSNSVEKPQDIGLGEKIVKSVGYVAGNDITIWGGAAGDDLMFKETFVFTNTNISNKGILMLVMNEDKILVKGRAATGMKPFGTEKVITKSEGSWILEIDNQPATDLVMKYMGENLSPEDFKDFNLKNIFLNLMREDSSSIIRATMGFNMDTKGITVSGKIKTGDKFRFTFLPDFDVLTEVSENAKQFQKTEMTEADALVMFSCIGRIDAFGPMTSEELQGIQSVYNVPMAGFFSYGEYGRATGGNNEFHNMTCCWVALKEK